MEISVYIAVVISVAAAVSAVTVAAGALCIGIALRCRVLIKLIEKAELLRRKLRGVLPRILSELVENGAFAPFFNAFTGALLTKSA